MKRAASISDSRPEQGLTWDDEQAGNDDGSIWYMWTRLQVNSMSTAAHPGKHDSMM
jgi:hypothetical protein